MSSTEEWTQLVQRVDLLINELRAARAEAKRWRTRAAELERLHLKDEHSLRMEDQSKERELERLRRERKKVIQTVEKVLAEIQKAEAAVMENEKHE